MGTPIASDSSTHSRTSLYDKPVAKPKSNVPGNTDRGNLSCDALFRPRYGALGFVAMPNVWIFQVLFPLISPIMDLILIYTLISSALYRLQQPADFSFTNIRQVLFYYALFLAVDWCAAGFAFLLERKEHWRLLWWLFLQRFCYRQVMYYVMVKSVATAIRGAL